MIEWPENVWERDFLTKLWSSRPVTEEDKARRKEVEEELEKMQAIRLARFQAEMEQDNPFRKPNAARAWAWGNI